MMESIFSDFSLFSYEFWKMMSYVFLKPIKLWCTFEGWLEG